MFFKFNKISTLPFISKKTGYSNVLLIILEPELPTEVSTITNDENGAVPQEEDNNNNNVAEEVNEDQDEKKNDEVEKANAVNKQKVKKIQQELVPDKSNLLI